MNGERIEEIKNEINELEQEYNVLLLDVAPSDMTAKELKHKLIETIQSRIGASYWFDVRFVDEELAGRYFVVNYYLEDDAAPDESIGHQIYPEDYVDSDERLAHEMETLGCSLHSMRRAALTENDKPGAYNTLIERV